MFVVVLRPLPGVDPIRALRGALKALRRYHGLQALRVEPLGADDSRPQPSGRFESQSVYAGESV